MHHFDILFYAYITMIGFSLMLLGVEFIHFRYKWKNEGTWRPQKKTYEMNGASLSTDSTLRNVNFTRKTIKFFIEERVAEMQKINGQKF